MINSRYEIAAFVRSAPTSAINLMCERKKAVAIRLAENLCERIAEHSDSYYEFGEDVLVRVVDHMAVGGPKRVFERVALRQKGGRK